MHSLATRIGQFSTKELCQEVHFKEFDENNKAPLPGHPGSLL